MTVSTKLIIEKNADRIFVNSILYPECYEKPFLVLLTIKTSWFKGRCYGKGSKVNVCVCVCVCVREKGGLELEPAE